MESNFLGQQMKSESCRPSDSNNADGTTEAWSTMADPMPKSTPATSSMAFLNRLEGDLHHLQDEWAAVDVVLNSIKNAYPIQPLDNAPEELLDQVDRELCIAYDEVRSQVRQLSRSIKRLEADLEPYLALHRQGRPSPSLPFSGKHSPVPSGTAPPQPPPASSERGES